VRVGSSVRARRGGGGVCRDIPADEHGIAVRDRLEPAVGDLHH
jgi:hypothetical protein